MQRLSVLFPVALGAYDYLSLENLDKITKGCNIDGFCTGCFTGKYPIEVPKEIKKDRFEEKIEKEEK